MHWRHETTGDPLVAMRTTVTLDATVLSAARELAARQNRTLGSVVNEALRAFLEQPGGSTSVTQARFDLPIFEGSFTANPNDNAALRDAMERASSLQTS